ncbi:MAG: LUD domain-containing protein [Planctomycetales bacterium]|nr:LUD domain-containing protein [Planctomycetales bacterium]
MITSYTTSSKKMILDRIRHQPVPAVDLPSLQDDWIVYDEIVAQFSSAVESVGGQTISCESVDEIPKLLHNVPAFTDGKRILSMVDGLDVGNVSLDSIDDPHDLADLDFAILRGEFGVAENGAVWLDANSLKHRVVYFIPQHLALVVERNSLVNNMHEAYEKLEFSRSAFGVFMSGPSKTADIEQSLVIGAHGARSLTVLLVS